MKKVKFIHGADIHLDSPMIGLQSLPENIFKRLQKSTFKAFQHLIDAAIFHNVDFIILAGDIFDNADRSVRAQVFLRKEMERLAEKGIPAFIVHGNHDHMGGNWNEITYPSNVYIFGENVEAKEYISKDGVVIHIHGFSYNERHIFDRKIHDYQRSPGADFHIGILHGNMEGNSDHGNYAPFHLKELLEKEFDYWALGHIHKRNIIHQEPPVLYPGNTQGRNKKETGEKGCYLVTLQDSNPVLQFIETSEILWEDLLIETTDVTSFDGLLQLIQEKMSGIRREGKGVIVNLTLQNLASEVMGTVSVNELLELLQEEEKEEISLVWPAHIELQERIHWKREELSRDSDFYGELFKVMEEFRSLEQTIAPLYNQQVAKKLLTPLTSDEMEYIRKEAENLLIKRLLKNG